MKRAAIYSSTSRSREAERRAGPGATPKSSTKARDTGQPVSPAASSPVGSPPRRVRAFLRQHASWLLFAAGGLVALLLVLVHSSMQPVPREFTQEDIDAAVLNTLENKTLPSRAAKAAELVRQSVVRVRGFADDGSGGEKENGIGSGVVIVDDGVILTNMHVVAGAKRVTVTFFDGLEAEADLVGIKPESDLAVIRAKSIPDDLPAATLGSTQRLQPGDEVVAVGFPFGIGPTVTAGVISGLNREFRSPEGQRLLTRLIQFDAAANPGSSGGPLVTMDGEVIGIVTAILSPNEARTFVGIGFAVTIEAAGNAVGIPPF
ncbi:MAG TPA: trypsin-like peptidase domain-containing protein [Burkholderiales bacterium]|nr:trypsin-like peptidase domain-containing protein [Burkholderiales bacterium]